MGMHFTACTTEKFFPAKELVAECEAIAAQTGIEAVTVATVVEQMMEEIRQSMIGGENVYLRGFGSFILKHRAQKVARNIAKNTSITIPAHNIPAFKPSKEFMDKVK